jgi:hypothetical protein
MKAIIDGDLVMGFASGDIDGPFVSAEFSTLAPDRLRFVSGILIDAATLSQFHIDSQGRKHAVGGAGRQPLSCEYAADIVCHAGVWRVRTTSESIAPKIKTECGRRIFATASQNAQMNMTAAAAAGRFSSEDVATYAAALDWVDQMRTRCAELIAAADAEFATEAKWPAVPAGVSALAARF